MGCVLPVVSFHGFKLDAGCRVISRDGTKVHLTRKAFDLLTLLIEQAPRVVSKEELHQRLWRDTFVTDAITTGPQTPNTQIYESAGGLPFDRTSQLISGSRSSSHGRA